MTKKIASCVIDFGSSNSGCSYIPSANKYANPLFVHSDAHYSKDNTWFFIKADFLNQVRNSYNSLKDEDFKIKSVKFSETQNPNIIWGRKTIHHFLKENSVNGKNEWLEFSKFKMKLYKGEYEIKGRDEQNYPIETIITIFLRILKIECIHEVCKHTVGKRSVDCEEINWGVTIPSIWKPEHKDIMRKIAKKVFTNDTVLLSEPEGALMCSAIVQRNNDEPFVFKAGRTSVVVDLGGGTTDISLVREVQKAEGIHKFEEIISADGRAAGGNDIDDAFWNYLERYITKDLKDAEGKLYATNPNLDEILLGKYKKDYPSEWMIMEDEWFKLKHGETFDFAFNFTPKYKDWLLKENHLAVADRVSCLRQNGCLFDEDDLYQQVFEPTFNQITEKVLETIDRCIDKKIKIDTVSFAGGLSLDENLITKLKSAINKRINILPSNYRTMSGMWASGAILHGAGYLLVNTDLLDRIARRTYLFSVLIDSNNFNSKVHLDYLELEKFIDIETIEKAKQEQESYKSTTSSGKILYLVPICIKDKLACNGLIPLTKSEEGQTSVRTEIYSTDTFVLYPSKNNKDLIFEGEIEYDFKTTFEKLEAEINVNEAQVSGELVFILKDVDGKIIGKQHLKDAVQIGI
ncbi:MAG: hypothetical protein LBH32_02765 [Dysgonamonadaceae bacterium]|jgi:hypothetical protein|nr:hypothetical protein [Dysgonamonadaceae bacterium]